MTRKTVIGSLLLAFAGLQLFQPPSPRSWFQTGGPVSDHVEVPDGVDAILRRACYDCHSDHTRWPWYARVSPISWLIFRDVEHGLSNLDFSRWPADSEVEPTPTQRLNGICRDIEAGIMPPKSYLVLHPSAELSPSERGVVCDWTERALRNIAGDASTGALPAR